MEVYNTRAVEASLSMCDDIEEMKKSILPMMRDQRTAWVEKIEEILAARGYTVRQMAELCQVSEPAVRKWRRGSIPQSRDMYIRIGFAAGYGLDEMNSFLRRYGKCPQLYVKSLEDSVCMFVLTSETLEHTYETYLRVLQMVEAELGESDDGPVYSTQQMSDQFSSLQSLDEMMTFARTNAAAYRQAYARLYSYIIAFVEVNLQSEYDSGVDTRKASFHAMATESQWSSSLRHCITQIRRRKWFPLRHKLISLGLHLNMDTEAINRMLRHAQMEPLYAKNPIEAAIMWAIEEAKLNSDTDSIVPDGSSDLSAFVKDVLLQLELSDEDNYLIDDL